MANLNRDELRRLARLGAMARLTQIRAEEAAIREEFPELFGGSAAKAARRQGRRGRKGMSAAARKSVSERMRKYWAERRKAKAK